MKTEFIELSATRKNLVVEVPSAVVEAEIDRLARRYSRSVRVPGFRPGRVPPHVVRQRFREQILHDVAHDLIPRVMQEALEERGMEPVEAPSIRDVTLQEGHPLTFTASFETLPPIDPGDYSAFTLRRPPVEVGADQVDETIEQLRHRAARHEPVTERGAEPGDIVIVDLERRPVAEPGGGTAIAEPERHTDVAVELGGRANPPGFDGHLVGRQAGDRATFTVTFPADYGVAELAGTRVEYAVVVKAVRRRVLPELDDEFARDLGSFETLMALRDQVGEDLTRQAAREADRQVRADLLRQLAARVAVDLPDALVAREIDRRVEHLAGQLLAQRIDPRHAGIDWAAFREEQRPAATDAVRAGLVLDEIARREAIAVGEADLDQDIARHAERTGRTPVAVRALLEKEGGIERVRAGLRRERTIDFLLSRATIVTA